MSNYAGFTRTNYFKVRDEALFQGLINNYVTANDSIKIFESNVNGQKVFGFGCHGSLCEAPSSGSEDNCADALYSELRQVVANGHAILITEVGYDKLRYLVANCTIITANAVSFIDLNEAAIGRAQEMLCDSMYQPQMDY